ncbi:MAG: DinB family protein [Planctomycetales bacterium]|nr:DinB family protein [Planctomycetales bacterium]
MQHVSILQDLFDHGDWANAKVFQLASDLPDDSLDEPREMGFGSLRNTLFHIVEAEAIWLERWQGKPWRPLRVDAAGAGVAEIRALASTTAAERNALLAAESADGVARRVTFQDSQQREWAFALGDLMHHVANHGIHHRAQALSYLKSFDRTVPAGLDYLFWKLARPSCDIPPESLPPLRAFGLEVATEPGLAPAFDKSRVERYFAYSDWAMNRVFTAAADVAPAELDRDFAIGMGTLRRNLQHLVNAERWWLANWQSDRSDFPRDEEQRSLPAIAEQHAEVARQRSAFVAQLTAADADRVVCVTAGGPDTKFRVTESLLQLCCHGTHHRCQCLNMLRQSNVAPPQLDIIFWLRESPA